MTENKVLLGAIDRLVVRCTDQRSRKDIRTLVDAIIAAERDRDRLREALTPSEATKQAYMGEFYFEAVPDVKVFVPWTTIKEIMAKIRDRAALQEA